VIALVVLVPSFPEATREAEKTTRFNNRVAIITAAASGIGRAVI
jgi:hypothetical protein